MHVFVSKITTMIMEFVRKHLSVQQIQSLIEEDYNVNVPFLENIWSEDVADLVKLMRYLSMEDVNVMKVSIKLVEFVELAIPTALIMVQTVNAIMDTMEMLIIVKDVILHVENVVDQHQINAWHVWILAIYLTMVFVMKIFVIQDFISKMVFVKNAPIFVILVQAWVLVMNVHKDFNLQLKMYLDKQ